MINTDELRRALHEETAGLAVQVPMTEIRRRARRVRTRQAWLVGAAGVTVAAVAISTIQWIPAGPGPAPSPVGTRTMPHGAQSAPPSAGPAVPPERMPPASCATAGPVSGEPVRTGLVVNDGWELTLRLTGLCEYPTYTIYWTNRETGRRSFQSIYPLYRGPAGDIPGKHDTDPSIQFLTNQFAVGPHEVIDAGLYAGIASRITVGSEGVPTNAAVRVDPVIGWTLFWVRRSATPMPSDANTTAVPYSGPALLTVTAYGPDGQQLHTITGGYHVGHGVQDPTEAADQTDYSGPTVKST